MSIETLPIYPNLFDLDDKTISEIEEKCVLNGHLSKDIKLLDQIRKDAEILSKHNISGRDIYQNHRNMFLKFNRTNKYNRYDTFSEGKTYLKFLETLPKKFGEHWCYSSMTTNEIELNGQHLIIDCMTWNGSERCPIEGYFSKTYHGYHRGDRDWFIENVQTGEMIWIPDLVPAQIGMFNFFQSETSEYRIDIEKYIRLMGITSKIEPLKQINIPTWRYHMTVSKKNIYYYPSQTPDEEIDNDDYHVLLYKSADTGKKILFIRFKNRGIEKRIQENIEKFDNWEDKLRNDGIYLFDRLLHYIIYEGEDYNYYIEDTIIKIENDEEKEMEKIAFSQMNLRMNMRCLEMLNMQCHYSS